MRRRWIAVAVAVSALTGTGATASTPPRSGVYGTVLRGPVSPICVAEQPCEVPAAGARLRFTRNGVTSVVTVGATGTYRIRLAAGTYAIAASGGRVDPASVQVRRFRFRRTDLSIDTGIR